MTQPEAENRSVFPPPPPFYHLYTKDRLEVLDGSRPDFWSPPPIPTENDGKFLKFGVLESDNPIQFELGDDISKLYDDSNGHIDYSVSMVKLNKDTLENYISILKILLSSDPTKTEKHLSHIKNCFHNMRHLMNMLRPHQARQTIIEMLQLQNKEINEKSESLENYVSECRNYLSENKDPLEREMKMELDA